MATTLPLPPGWRVETIWNPTLAKTGLRGFYWGYCFPGDRVILLLPRWWIVPLWHLIRGFVLRHELGHAWGIPAAGCLGRYRWCVMAEEHLVGESDGSGWGKAKLLWHQLTDRRGRGKFCLACRSYLGVRMAGDDEQAADLLNQATNR